MDPQKHVLKVVGLIALILIAGYFILGKNNAGNTGRVIDTAKNPDVQTAIKDCSSAVNISHDENLANCRITVTKEDCSTNNYSGTWDATTNSCSPHN